MWKPTCAFTIIKYQVTKLLHAHTCACGSLASEKRHYLTEKEEKRREEWRKSNGMRIFEQFSFGFFRKWKWRPKSKIDWHETRHRQGNEMWTNTHQRIYALAYTVDSINARIFFLHLEWRKGKTMKWLTHMPSTECRTKLKKTFIVSCHFSIYWCDVECWKIKPNTKAHMDTSMSIRKTPGFHSDSSYAFCHSTILFFDIMR